MISGIRPLRIAAVALVATAGAILIVAAAWPHVHDAARLARAGAVDAPFEQVILDLVACGLVLVYLAGIWSLTVTVAAELAGSRLPVLRKVAVRLQPQSWRELALALCGLGLVAGPGLGVTAAVGAASGGLSCQPPCVETLTGLRLPELPIGAPLDSRPGITTVQAGDSLWAIANDHLPTDASAAHVAESVREWHHSNRHTIGRNPNLIFPGMQLRNPEGTTDDHC